MERDNMYIRKLEPLGERDYMCMRLIIGTCLIDVWLYLRTILLLMQTQFDISHDILHLQFTLAEWKEAQMKGGFQQQLS